MASDDSDVVCVFLASEVAGAVRVGSVFATDSAVGVGRVLESAAAALAMSSLIWARALSHRAARWLQLADSHHAGLWHGSRRSARCASLVKPESDVVPSALRVGSTIVLGDTALTPIVPRAVLFVNRLSEPALEPFWKGVGA